MYAGAGFSDWEIGDVDVIINDGVYHLFHLIIPNHDYIAHAISTDGISWRRVKNAIFVGDPGEWDDDMLWTMHVSQSNGKFQMYYTGLRRRDRGQTQRIGLASSHDLLNWEKVERPDLPLEPQTPYYEISANSPREWTSFRDPFFFRYRGASYLLISARASSGPASRRGCVGLAQLVDGRWSLQPPILFPRMYDDIECPCLCTINGKMYLIGSLREDITVRYWIADDLQAPYRSFHFDMLLPQGNYAARVVRDGNHWLIYNFYYTDGQVNSLRVLPPPKQLDTDDRGRLILKSFYRWDKMTQDKLPQNEFAKPCTILDNDTSTQEIQAEHWSLSCRSGYELLLFEKPCQSIIWEGRLILEDMGKSGLVIDADEEGNGYFIPFDFVNGYVTIRSWGFNPLDNRKNFVFNPLQSNLFQCDDDRRLHFKLIRYGNYIELSVNGVIKLTLIDYTFTGSRIGLYSASSTIVLSDSVIYTLPDSVNEYASQENVFTEKF